jgi:hypothetical protein
VLLQDRRTCDDLQADKLSAGQFVADYTELPVQRTARDV